MTPSTLETLRARLRETDRRILDALAARAGFPRRPVPDWTPPDPRLPEPPLADLLAECCPEGEAQISDSLAEANRNLTEALRARQELAVQIAEAKSARHPADFEIAMSVGNRDLVDSLLTDLSMELQRLQEIQTDAAASPNGISPEQAAILWREYMIPWTRQSEADHLLVP